VNRPILMYHAIAPVDGPLRGLGVPPHRLRHQLTALRDAGYRLTGLTEALADPAADVVALTFDDAYRSFLDALPILDELGAGATLYVPVAHVGRSAEWLGAQGDGFGPILDWPRLREVAAAGIEIGNHGLTHEPLDVLPTATVAEMVATSRERIAVEVGQAARSFAYPHGYQTAAVRAAVSASGHHNAVIVGRRLARTDRDRYALPRLQPTPDHDGADLVRMVDGRAELLPQVRRLAQPGWRLTRRLARTAGVRPT
jgi:peptidoglycan/xylan/chitin deacetylase (PgdA/CDA1 family)